MKMIRVTTIKSKIATWINVGCIESLQPRTKLNRDGEWVPSKGTLIYMKGSDEPYVVKNDIEDIISAISCGRMDCGPKSGFIQVLFVDEGQSSFPITVTDGVCL